MRRGRGEPSSREMPNVYCSLRDSSSPVKHLMPLTASGANCLHPPTRRRLVRLKSMCGTEVVPPRGIDQVRRNLERAAFERTDIGNSIQEISGLTTLHRATFFAVLTKQVAHALVAHSQAS